MKCRPRRVMDAMTKFLPVKLLFLAVSLLIAPFSMPLFSQDDGNFDFGSDEAWGDDANEDDVFLDEEPAAQPEPEKPVAAKPETKAAAVTPSPAPSAASTTRSTTATTPSRSSVSSPPPVASKPKKVFSPVKPAASQYQASGTVKRAGPPLLMIARPVYAPYSNEDKTMYISATAEAYFHFKLGALPGIQVVPYERINNTIQYFRDFTRRISRTSYIDNAKKIGASYLLYSEYEPKGKKIKFATELYSLDDNKKIGGSISEIELSSFEDGLYDFANEAAGILIGTIPAETQKFLATPVLGKGSRTAEQLGKAIVAAGDFTLQNSEKAASEFEKLSRGGNQYLAKYIGALNFSRANQYDKAIELLEELIVTFGTEYPALSLQLATFYRLAKSYDQALQAAEKAGSDPSLALVARIEKARIYEAQGNLSQAKKEYESVLSEGGEDGEIYFQLALVSIGLNNLSQAQSYLRQSASAGRSFDKADYFDLGLRYEALGTANDQAIEAYRNSLGIQQDNVDAWEKLAEIYSKSGREADAAECYVNLFQINNTAYKDNLVKAGIMFENAGYLENAKDAYSLFLARKFTNPEVNVRLAKIELQGGNCKKAIDLVDNMDTTGTFGSDVASINSQCGKQERRVVIANDANQRNWRGPFIWRVSSGAITIAGAILGYVLEGSLKKQYDVYLAAENVESVDAARSKLKTLETQRNLSYLGAGVGLVSFGFSIALPIVFSK